MRPLARFTLMGAFASALLVLSSFSVSHADGVLDEIQLNSSTVQVVHNTTANTDVLNMSLNVTDLGELGDCSVRDLEAVVQARKARLQRVELDARDRPDLVFRDRKSVV